MAGTSAMQGEGSADRTPTVLERLAKEDTFDLEWPVLRQQLHDAILATVPIFLSMGPPRNRQSAPSPTDRQPQTSSSEVSSGTPPSELPPSSPPGGSGTAINTTISSSSKSSITADDGDKTPSPLRRAIAGENQGSSPIIGPQQTAVDELPEELRPSTRGGLVIAPFPPLDPNRRKKGVAGTQGPKIVSIAPRPNGLGHPTPPPIRITSGNVFDDEWDEEVVIGGKKLAGWMDEEEGKKEANRLVKLLDEMNDPPFTIQRLAELLVRPTTQHKTLGKFFRAIEKILLVSTPWEAPSYTYVPGTTFSAPEYTSASSDSTMPPGMGTPSFSPIPFLRRPSPDAEGSGSNGLEVPGGHTEEALMSPLILGQGDTNVSMAEEYQLDEMASARSPTPEPEESQAQPQAQPTSDDIEMASNASTPSSSDPGHQPYLGRVDELDTGPIQGNNNEQKEGRDDGVAPGTGEGGAMTAHGMSEKPVPISSTTVIANEERKIASLPAAGESEKR